MAWPAVIGAISSVYSLLFGGGTNANGQQSPGLGTQVVQSFLPESDAQKSANATADLTSAREYQPTDLPQVIMQEGLINLLVGNCIRLVNAAIDALNHSIRPGVLVWLLGGFGGYWVLPDSTKMDAFWQSILYLVVTFWFGGRTVIKDIPAALAAFIKLKSK